MSEKCFKTGGVGFSRKFGDQRATLLLMTDPSSLDKCMFASLTPDLKAARIETIWYNAFKKEALWIFQEL
jgi:hypothetical protein